MSVEAAVREIEVKYRVENLEALLAVLKSRGIELSEPVIQDDQAYAPIGWHVDDSPLGSHSLGCAQSMGVITSRSSNPRNTPRPAWSTRLGSLTARRCTIRSFTWAIAGLYGS